MTRAEYRSKRREQIVSAGKAVLTRVATYCIQAKNTNRLIPFRALVRVPVELFCHCPSEEVNPLGHVPCGIGLSRDATGERIPGGSSRRAAIFLIQHKFINRDIVRDWRQFTCRLRGEEDHLGDLMRLWEGIGVSVDSMVRISSHGCILALTVRVGC